MRVRKALADKIKFTALTVQWAYTVALYFDEPELQSDPALSAASYPIVPPDTPLQATAAG